jgi:hypothetical protein
VVDVSRWRLWLELKLTARREEIEGHLGATWSERAGSKIVPPTTYHLPAADYMDCRTNTAYQHRVQYIQAATRARIGKNADTKLYDGLLWHRKKVRHLRSHTQRAQILTTFGALAASGVLYTSFYLCCATPRMDNWTFHLSSIGDIS